MNCGKTSNFTCGSPLRQVFLGQHVESNSFSPVLNQFELPTYPKNKQLFEIDQFLNKVSRMARANKELETNSRGCMEGLVEWPVVMAQLHVSV